MILIAFTGLVEEFNILDKNTSTQGVAYDYWSIMHPGVLAFAKGKCNTIVPLKFTGNISVTTHPTLLDIFHVNILYCEGNEYD